MLRDAEATQFCGFALHINELVPEWRRLAYAA
jgi:hypothetical protein